MARKLKYNLAEAAERGDRALMTFGGVFQSHQGGSRLPEDTVASTVEVVRGEEQLPLNPVAGVCGWRNVRRDFGVLVSPPERSDRQTARVQADVIPA
jgi:hypothetical protein